MLKRGGTLVSCVEALEEAQRRPGSLWEPVGWNLDAEQRLDLGATYYVVYDKDRWYQRETYPNGDAYYGNLTLDGSDVMEREWQEVRETWPQPQPQPQRTGPLSPREEWLHAKLTGLFVSQAAEPEPSSESYHGLITEVGRD